MNIPTLLRLATALITMHLFAPGAIASELHQNDVARYLAGLDPSPHVNVRHLTDEPAWRTHAQALNTAWTRLETTQLAPIRAWGAARLDTPSPTLIYMFSGPDALYARNFFPDARTYVLAGLEPPGPLIDPVSLSADERRKSLERLRASMKSIVGASFFITADMRKDLEGHAFSGVLPLIYVFLARSGMEITEVRHVSLGPDGETTVLREPGRSRPSGVEIFFWDPERVAERRLIYFSVDLSDGGLVDGVFLRFLKRQGPADAFFKSASYLPHSEGFSRIRTAVLEASVRILQDDTGVPLDAFDPALWRVTPYGRYNRPIPVFNHRYQPGMVHLFETQSPEPIDFRLGYGSGTRTTGVLLAKRR